ncbi:MAG: hypothetical protein ACI8RD_012984 [Bacillariaceae sp.]|jgi:hypothetical protein
MVILHSRLAVTIFAKKKKKIFQVLSINHVFNVLQMLRAQNDKFCFVGNVRKPSPLIRIALIVGTP